MSTPLDRPGRFRCANPKPLGISQAKDSKSLSAIIDFPVVEHFNDETGEWIPWDYGMAITGYLVIVKKDGELNATQAEAFVRHLGWNGDLNQINENSGWQPKPCQITVDENTYNGRTSLKVNWINDWNSEGGQIRKADDATVKQLSNQYGSKFRALVGNINRNAGAAQKPAGPAKPPAPVKRQPAPAPAVEGFDDTQYPEPGSNG